MKRKKNARGLLSGRTSPLLARPTQLGADQAGPSAPKQNLLKGLGEMSPAGFEPAPTPNSTTVATTALLKFFCLEARRREDKQLSLHLTESKPDEAIFRKWPSRWIPVTLARAPGRRRGCRCADLMPPHPGPSWSRAWPRNCAGDDTRTAASEQRRHDKFRHGRTAALLRRELWLTQVSGDSTAMR